MGAQSVEILVAKREEAFAKKTDVDTRIAGLSDQLSDLEGTIADLTDGIDDLGGIGPENTVVPTISGTAKVGQTLTAANGTWSGYPALSFSYVWKVAGVTVSGVTGSTYVPKTADIGKTIVVTVTGTNVLGADSASSVATSAVAA